MRLTIRRQILALAVSGFLLVLVAGVIGYVCTARLAAAQRTARDAADALSAVRAADTARTAFRAEVLAALVTRDSAERQGVLDQLGVQVLALRDGLTTVSRLEPDLTEQVAAMDGPVDGMIATGQRVVTLSSRVDSDPGRVAAAAARPAFDEQYQLFDKALPALEKELERKADQAGAESTAAARESQLLILGTAGLAAVVLGGSAVLLARRISRRVNATVRAARAVAAKDLTVDVQVAGNDELAEIGTSLNEVVAMVRGALTEIGDGAHALADASTRLLDTSRQLAAGAQTATDQARLATANVEQVTGSVDATASAIQGLLASISEIRAAVAEAARVAGEAVELAGGTNRTIERLGASSDEVGAVVNVITSIAEQTNLLALNATIEAARAGEQGKGFAVVAGEVKELSRETASATEDIDAKVTAMRADTGSAVEAISRITEVIGRIHEIQESVSAAIEVQTDATRSIDTSADVAARSSADIAQSVESVARATESTHSGATSTEAAAGELAALARRLQIVADQFHR